MLEFGLQRLDKFDWLNWLVGWLATSSGIARGGRSQKAHAPKYWLCNRKVKLCYIQWLPKVLKTKREFW